MTYSSVISDEVTRTFPNRSILVSQPIGNVPPRNETEFDILGGQMRMRQISPDAAGFVLFDLILMYLLALEYRTAQ